METIGLYINASGGMLSVLLDDYVLFDDSRKAHSLSSSLNPWISDGRKTIRLIYKPTVETSVDFLPIVSCYLHRSEEGRDDEAIIAEQPVPGEPGEETVIPGINPGTFSSVERRYEIDTADFEIGPWIRTPKPWEGSHFESEGFSSPIEFYRILEKAFARKDARAVVALANDKISFTSKVNQVDPGQMKKNFEASVNGVLSSPEGIETCVDPALQLEEFPILKGKVHRLRWPSGLGTIQTKSNERGFQQGFDVVCGKGTDNLWHWVW